MSLMKRDVKMLISLKTVVGTDEASAVLLQDLLQGEALLPILDYHALMTYQCQQVGGFRDACDAACKTACRFEETCPLISDSCDLGSSFLSKIRDSNPSYSLQQRNPFCSEDIAMPDALRIDPTPERKVGHDTLEAVSVLQETEANSRSGLGFFTHSYSLLDLLENLATCSEMMSSAIFKVPETLLEMQTYDLAVPLLHHDVANCCTMNT